MKHELYKRTRFAALIITGAALVELLGYIFSGSLMVRTDAYHGFIDAIPFWATVLALYFSHTGSKRQGVSVCLGFLGAFVISWMVFDAVHDAVLRLGQPIEIHTPIAVLSATVGLSANMASAWILREHQTSHHLIRITYLHNLSDTMLSIIVLSGLLFTGGNTAVDALVTIGAGVYLLLLVVKNLLREAIRGLRELVEKRRIAHAGMALRDMAGIFPGVLGTCFHVDEREFHVVLPTKAKPQEILRILKTVLKRHKVPICIRIERMGQLCGSKCCSRFSYLSPN